MKYRLEIVRMGKVDAVRDYDDRRQFIADWYKHNTPNCYPRAIVGSRALTIAQMERFIELTREKGEQYRKVLSVGGVR